jgi:hypothetical protein
LLLEQDWAVLSLKQLKSPDQSNMIDEDQQKLLDLHKIINTKTLHQIYKSLPFNKDLPKTSDKAKNNPSIINIFETYKES